jgi:hypothetical protein
LVFYLDSKPTHSYLKFPYKCPQAACTYASLLDTAVFNEDRYVDAFVEYAKALLRTRRWSQRAPETVQLWLSGV